MGATVHFRCSGALDRADLWHGASLTIEEQLALDALAFAGLRRASFGGDKVRNVEPLLRRALWPSRCAPPHLRAVLLQFLDLCIRAGRDEGVFVYAPDSGGDLAP